MPDPLITDRLGMILVHARKIQLRLQITDDASYFISSEAGKQLYGSLITRLQAIPKLISVIENFLSLKR